MGGIEANTAVPGVDALLFGTGDLSLSMGIPLAEKDASKEIEDAILRMNRVALSNGKLVGFVCMSEEIPRRREQGYSFFAVSMSVALISDPMRQLLREARRYAE